MRAGLLAFTAALPLLAAATSGAQADGYPPYYGYSPYFGAPATYFDGDDVQQATLRGDGLPGFGTRTYYRGGPFWAYKPNTRRAYYPRAQRRKVVLHRKG